ncbi:MAG: CNNM domain-containing protein [Planctomycetota bacterium]|jgi:CBS domain containing-hemolysin-like protein
MDAFLETPGLLTPAVVMVCLLGGSAFFSSSETALFFLSSDEVQAFGRSKRRSERRVAALLRDPDRLLTAVLFWNLVINLSFFACGIVISGRLIEHKHAAVAGLFSVLSVSLMIVCGEVMPKSGAVLFRQGLARLVSIPLAVAVRGFDPLAPTFRKVTRSMRRMFWPHIQKEQYLDPEDLEQAIDNSAGSRSVIRQERIVLHNILDLSEIPIEEVMRPRGTFPALQPPIDLGRLKDSKQSTDYLVVLNGDGESIAGAIPLGQFASFPDADLEDTAEPVIHVPWCATVAYVLHQLETQSCSVSAVVNEYGDTIGIVTYEDIVDTILAPDPSRARRVLQRDPVLNVAPGSWHVDGITSLRYLCRRLKVRYQPDEDGLITVAGMFFDELERIPEVGDECIWNGYRLRVIETRRPGHFRALLTQTEGGR